MDELMRMAGVDLGLDIREGLGRFDLDEMRRAFRRDKLIPRSLASEMNKMAPENSEPVYSITGSYQPGSHLRAVVLLKPLLELLVLDEWKDRGPLVAEAFGVGPLIVFACFVSACRLGGPISADRRQSSR